MAKHTSIVAAVMILVTVTAAWGQNLERAKLYHEHGLLSEAKVECIQIVTSDNPDNEKATAYYILGLVAFDQKRVGTAMDTWSELSQKYPNSPEAAEVSERLDQLSQIVGETQEEYLDNAIARSYLRHGDFWSRRKSSVFTIDSSWIPNVEASIKWYDKTIEEFPGTAAARVAYEKKMRTLLGWEEPGRYGSKHGIENDPDKYIPILVQAFREYEGEFPESGSLQAFRYQVAQAYWGQKDWDNTRSWLNTIIEQSGDQESFYADLAKRRLQKLEY